MPYTLSLESSPQSVSGLANDAKESSLCVFDDRWNAQSFQSAIKTPRLGEQAMNLVT